MQDDAYCEDEIGEWLHERLMERFGLETERWAIERVARVTDRLNLIRFPDRPLRTEILWLQEMSAFIGPGRYLYVSREFLQRTTCDEAAALVIAHEMAHHDLGHTSLFQGQLAALRKMPAGIVAAAVSNIAQTLLLGPEREMEADAYGLDLCRKALYRPELCLQALDIIEAYLLDHGDLEGVYGSDDPRVAKAPSRQTWMRLAKWGHERARGYLPLHERRAALLARMDV